MTAPDSELVDALESAGCTVNGNSVGCAFHDDRKASGSIYTGTDGRSRYKCHGCEVAGDAADIIARHTGRPLAEVLKEREGGSVSKARIPIRNVQENKAQPSFATVEALAKALHHKTPEAVYRYQTADGRDHLAVMRLPEKQFRQARWTANGWQSGGVGEPFPLCHQPALAGDVSAVVVVTEGEKDADALATLGIMATSAPMGADAVTCPPEKDGKPGKVDWSPLAGRTVVLFGDDDLPGRNHMARVARCLSRLNPPPMISMVRVEDHQGCKDAADLIAAHGADAVRQAIAQAVPWNKPEVVEESPSAELTVVTAANLVATHSDYRKPLIEGLLREGETMNIIAAPKVGKSWLVLLLAFSVANGLSFLGRKCAQGSVLIIDNELHPETAAQRLRSVADALGVGLENVHLVSLRGQLEDLPTLRSRIERAALKVGARLIVLDALYRLLPVGASENDNAGMMQLYNEIDGIARESGASIIAIHHSSKGNQGEKGVTDGGAGAGSISRAADSHMFLREHEDEGHVVVDAVARSWPPPASVVIGRPNLLWEIVPGADASRIKGRKAKQSDAFTMEDLVQRFIPIRPEAVATIQARVESCGLRVARGKLEGLLGLAATSGRIVCEIGSRGAKQYGRTASPAVESGTLEARAAAYHKDHPGASHAAIAAAVGCNPKTIQRALRAGI